MHLGYPVDAESALQAMRNPAMQASTETEGARKRWDGSDGGGSAGGSADTTEAPPAATADTPLAPAHWGDGGRANGAPAEAARATDMRSVHFDNDTLETLEYELDDLATVEDDFEGAAPGWGVSGWGSFVFFLFRPLCRVFSLFRAATQAAPPLSS